MPPNERGTLAFALQVAYSLTVLVLMGTERPFLATQEGAFPTQFRGYVDLVKPGLIGAFLLGAVGIAAACVWLPSKVPIVASVVVYTVLNAVSLSVRVAYISSGECRPFAMNAVLTQVVIVGGALALGGLSIGSADTWVLIYVASGIVPLALYLKSVVGTTARVPLSAESRRALQIRGLRLLPAAFSNTAMVRSDRLLMPLLSTSAELGRYVVVATVMEMATWPIRQWADASLRRWSVERVDVTRFTFMARPLLMTLAVVSGLGIMCYVVVILVLPMDYHAAVSVIVPLGIASLIYAWTRLQQGILIARGASGRVSVIESIGMGVSVCAYIVLIPPLGMLGAAVGSAIGYFACGVAGAWCLSQRRPKL